MEKMSPVIFETWKPVVYPKVQKEYYEVSSFGRLRNKKCNILKSCRINSGYDVFRLFKDKENRHVTNNRYVTVTVHRLVATHFIHNINDHKTVNHIDGNKQNNVVTNLEWISQRENNHHARSCGLNEAYGERAGSAKLTDRQARTICELLQDRPDITYKEILRIIGFENSANAQDMVGNIKRRVAWKWMSKDYVW